MLEFQNRFYGLRFTDDKGVVIYEKKWCHDSLSEDQIVEWNT